MNRFIVGSNAFFSKFSDFTPHDNDVLFLEDNPTEYKIQSQIRLRDNCYFKWKRMSPEEFIDAHKGCTCGLLLGKFLVPEFAKEIGLTIEHLKKLDFLVNLLDDKHKYEEMIYNYYIENNDFYLTDEQLNNVYEEYKIKRDLSKK